MTRRPVIAIDGPSGAGKSTVARGLARALGFAYVDTGSLYRTVALLADRAGIDWDAGERLAALAEAADLRFTPDGDLLLNGEAVGDAIRTPHISRGASVVARHQAVRRALTNIQRRIGAGGGVVLEGRDIGSVVFPDAEAKFFLTASVAERARRRHRELVARGAEISLEQVEREQEERDRADREREESPLVRSPDAREIDCDALDAAAVIALIEGDLRARFPLTS
jgi:cytidylate kinase